MHVSEKNKKRHAQQLLPQGKACEQHEKQKRTTLITSDQCLSYDRASTDLAM